MKRKCIAVSLVAMAFASALQTAFCDVNSPSSTIRYATDAYPGFDREEKILSSSKKTPRWFSWLRGPKKDNAADQFAWAGECEKNGAWSKALKAYDAIVRNWPASPEAPKAQQRVAELYLEKELDSEEAFNEYKYLIDFYSSQCAYDEIVFKLYEVAKLMEEEGKYFVFFHFDNTVDVRRAFEAVVLRAPGAAFAPEAMMKVAKLREDELEFEKASLVYETLRSLHPYSAEAKTALYREAQCRMKLLRAHQYNRGRAKDVLAFLKSALAANPPDDVKADLETWLAETTGIIEDEAFAAAKFYDSRTRTKRSAINAYEKFLVEYPASSHTAEARARLAELEKSSNQ